MMRFIPVPIDEQAARTARGRAAHRPPAREADDSLWAGVLFWLGFAMLAVIAGL